MVSKGTKVESMGSMEPWMASGSNNVGPAQGFVKCKNSSSPTAVHTPGAKSSRPSKSSSSDLLQALDLATPRPMKKMSLDLAPARSSRRTRRGGSSFVCDDDKSITSLSSTLSNMTLLVAELMARKVKLAATQMAAKAAKVETDLATKVERLKVTVDEAKIGSMKDACKASHVREEAMTEREDRDMEQQINAVWMSTSDAKNQGEEKKVEIDAEEKETGDLIKMLEDAIKEPHWGSSEEASTDSSSIRTEIISKPSILTSAAGDRDDRSLFRIKESRDDSYIEDDSTCFDADDDTLETWDSRYQVKSKRKGRNASRELPPPLWLGIEEISRWLDPYDDRSTISGKTAFLEWMMGGAECGYSSNGSTAGGSDFVSGRKNSIIGEATAERFVFM